MVWIPLTSICLPGINVVDDPNLFTIPLPIGGLTIALTGPLGQVDLGLVQKENMIPDLTAVKASYAGDGSCS